ncbi:MAG: hypothetical protein CMD38_04670 [Flavobacteriales bacterium]|nr:hypothetical protein [Flavobacteriales bacterium]
MSDFLFQKKTKKFQLVIESIDTLCKIEKSSLKNSIKNKRKKEIKAKEKLIKKLFPDEQLSYSKFGAPQLSNGNAISLSHSKELFAVITAEKVASVDIEPIDKKAFRLKNKFLDNVELNFIKHHETATLLWCAKECLYKLHQRGNINFKQDLKICQLSNNHIECSLINKTYFLKYKKINKHWLVYYFD